MKLSLFNKKGSVQDYIIIPVTLIVLGFCSIFSYLLLDSILNGFDTAGFLVGDAVTVASNFRSAILLFDKIIVFVMIAMLIGLGYLNYKINSKPVFFILFVILMPFAGFISYFFNYLFIQLISDPAFSTIITQFPLTLKICTNLHWITLASFIIGSITLFGKGQEPQSLGRDFGGSGQSMDNIEDISTEELSERLE
jgi:hypothetical protein